MNDPDRTNIPKIRADYRNHIYETELKMLERFSEVTISESSPPLSQVQSLSLSLLFVSTIPSLLLHTYPSGDLSSLVTRCNHSYFPFSSCLKLLLSSFIPLVTRRICSRDTITVLRDTRKTPPASQLAPSRRQRRSNRKLSSCTIDCMTMMMMMIYIYSTLPQ